MEINNNKKSHNTSLGASKVHHLMNIAQAAMDGEVRLMQSVGLGWPSVSPPGQVKSRSVQDKTKDKMWLKRTTGQIHWDS